MFMGFLGNTSSNGFPGGNIILLSQDGLMDFYIGLWDVTFNN